MDGAPTPYEKEYVFCPTCKSRLSRKRIDRRNLLSCSDCGFVFWNNPKPVTSVILEKDGKVLLIKRSQEPLKGYWCLPGGYIDYEEKPEDAAVRETGEETGLNVKIVKLSGVYQIDNDPRGMQLDIIYAGSITSGKVKVNVESSEFGFFSRKELPKLIAYKHRQAILDWWKSR